jgi:2-polyprenyl-3-methyl-5-hydroxy-6-metoxy-1,4-benzoquinol methylase
LEVGVRFVPKDPPRRFEVGNSVRFAMSDCGALELAPDEQVTLTTADGGEYDVARKDWGFYATPSLNGRLPQFGLRGVLIRNKLTGRYFVLLVERGHDRAFEAYMRQESLEIVAWLDSTERIDALAARFAVEPAKAEMARCRFDGAPLDEVFAYDAPPKGETRFDLGQNVYRRAYDRCEACGHFFARNDMDLKDLYAASYVDATYGGPEGLRARLEKVRALPPERSDNAGRVARIASFAERRGGTGKRLLDVGAGIGVFAAGMKDLGWDIEAIELDERTAQHLRGVVGIRAHTDDLKSLRASAIAPFRAVTFNKVLEHVEDPVGMLVDALPLTAADGFIYVEVPDVAAAEDGPEREEFFIEHLHVFAPASLAMTIERAGLNLIELTRLREPSGKFTVFAFATVRA